MISVILYGRNDSHGYNLPKRAAISLNGIAEVLSDPDDEIVFVDCNTPDDMPTFPEAIRDTLTPRARELLRVLRVRPAVYDRHRNGTRFDVLEPLCRNVAIRRSRPGNRWILCTNTDMVFVPREKGRSLSEIVSDLPDGFYELPRFEVPEALWESLDRSDPGAILRSFEEWGRSLHLNEVVRADRYNRFDGPGDFQLMLRSQIFEIDGFDESMVLGWHVDSNLCRRMNLLNGRTDSLLDRCFAYHCDHTRCSTVYHTADRTENDADRFVKSVSSPRLPGQSETWGIAGEEIEEIRLTGGRADRFPVLLGELLPGMEAPFLEDDYSPDSFNRGLNYDTEHTFPYLADHLAVLPPGATIGYVGGNPALPALAARFRQRLGEAGEILYDGALIDAAGTGEEPGLPAACVASDYWEIGERADMIVVDFAMMAFPRKENRAGVSVPVPTEEAIEYVRDLGHALLQVAELEKRRVEGGAAARRKFLFVGCQNALFEPAVLDLFDTVTTPYSSHVKHGRLRADAFTRPVFIPVHTLVIGDGMQARLDWLRDVEGVEITEDRYVEADRKIQEIIRAASDPASFNAAFSCLAPDPVDCAVMRGHILVKDLDGDRRTADALRKWLDAMERAGAGGRARVRPA
jgi:hypothetical protein